MQGVTEFLYKNVALTRKEIKMITITEVIKEEDPCNIQQGAMYDINGAENLKATLIQRPTMKDFYLRLEYANGKYGCEWKFGSLEEAKTFVCDNFTSKKKMLNALVEKTCKESSLSRLPCLEYFDSKYRFDRTRGGWWVYNEGSQHKVGSIARAKYGSMYWLRLEGLGLVSVRNDLSEIKKLTVELLNGKKDIMDTFWAYQMGRLEGNLRHLKEWG